MFKLEKTQLESIHSGHFMVSRLDDDDEENNNEGDDSSSQGEENGGSVEIDVNNPEVIDDINYRINIAIDNKNEQLTSWNDLDRPQSNKQQYIVYYTSKERTSGSTKTSEENKSVPFSDVIYSSASKHQNKLNEIDNLNAENELSMALHNHSNQLLHNHPQSSVLTMQSSLQQHIHGSNQPHIFIDATLTKLLECMSLYYSSKLTSPKWKSFKGSNLRLKKKIRLNNLIWRAWFLQYIRGKRPPGCQFVAPVDPDVHKKSETIVLEGKYWKRKVDAIVHEYQKWRRFHKLKIHMNCFRPSSFDWDTRVSNLASTSHECNFYPDYDMNIPYNLDDLPPMLEEIEATREDSYCTSLAPTTLPPAALSCSVATISTPNPTTTANSATTTNPSTSTESVPSLKRKHTAVPSGASQQKYSSTHRFYPQPQIQSQAPPPQSPLPRPQQHQPPRPQPPQQTQLQPISMTQISQQQQQQQHVLTPTTPSPVNVPTSYSSQPSLFYNPINEQIQQQICQPSQAGQSLSHLQQIQQTSLQQQFQHQSNNSAAMERDVISTEAQDILMSISDGGEGSVGGGTKDEQRRVCHINAEQKRRCNIKNGFDTLKSILPTINQHANVKISKAAMLQKAAQYIHTLDAEKEQQAHESFVLRKQIESLKQEINNYQCQLPASGAPIGCQGSNKAKEMLEEYVWRRTMDNWKFWIFSLLIEPLFHSYYNSVSTTSLEDSFRTIITWLSNSCGLVSMRRNALESLTFLSTTTNILNVPQQLPAEAVDAVRYKPRASSASTSTVSNSRFFQPTPSITAPQQQPQAAHLEQQTQILASSSSSLLTNRW